MTSISGRFRLLAVLAAGLVLMGGPPSAAAATHRPGRLDRSFNGTGRAIVGFGGRVSDVRAVAVQGARVLVAGAVGFESNENLALIRLTADGKLDRTFGGGDGRFVRNFFGDADIANAVTLLPGGKILVAGQAFDPVASKGRFVVLRLTPNGRLDRTFGGGDGIVITKFQPWGASGKGLTVLGDGRFAVCGSYASTPTLFAIARYRPNGGLDPTFNAGGLAVVDFPGATQSYCTALTHVGAKLVAVGTTNDGTHNSIAVAVFRPDGTPATGFDTDGIATYVPALVSDSGTGVVALPGGKLVISATAFDGVNAPDIALLRLSPDGTPDPGFGGGTGYIVDDIGSADQASGLVRQPGGKLLVVGFRNPDMFVARYTPKGARDPGFGKNGVQARPWSKPSYGAALAISGGKVVVAGSVNPGPYAKFAVERLFR